MIHDHENFLLARYPASWGVPRYQMGERVYVFSSDNPGTVTGLLFYEHPNHDGITEGEVGWWFQVELDLTAERRFVEPVGLHQEEVLQPLPTAVQPSYAELATV